MTRLFAGLAGLAFALLASQAALAQQKLKLGYALSPASHYGAGVEAFAAELARATNGRYLVEPFPSSALGGEREMIEGAQIGTLDLVLTSTGPVGNFVPETLVVDIPFLFRDYAHARAVFDGAIGQELLDKFPARGLVGLAWAENGFRHLTNGRRAVETPDDMKGLKLRTMQNEVHMQAFRALGALPTPMAFPEVFGALQQGAIDGQENPIPVIVSANLAQVQKHLTLTGHVYSPALFLMSKASWDKLAAADKDAMKAAAKAGVAANRAKVEAFERDGIEKLKASGMVVVADVDNARFQAALQPAYAEYAKKFGTATIERIRAVKP